MASVISGRRNVKEAISGNAKLKIVKCLKTWFVILTPSESQAQLKYRERVFLYGKWFVLA